jgi:hypothetical protein
MVATEHWNQKLRLSASYPCGNGRAGIKSKRGKRKWNCRELGKSDFTIEFPVSSDLERRCVDKLNQLMASREGTITLTASADGQPDKRALCRQLIKLIMADVNIREHDRTELCNFLACQSIKVRKDAQLRAILGEDNHV